MSTSNQSQYAPVAIDLQCDFPGTEVVLFDGKQKLIARGQQHLQTTVPPGIYTVRTILGDSLRDEDVIIRPDKPFAKSLTPPPFASAIPLDGSARSHEYHQSAARNAAAPELPLHADGTSSIFVLLREWTAKGEGQGEAGPLASILELCGADGTALHGFDVDVPDTGELYRAMSQGVRVRPGFYRLASRCGGARVEMALYAIDGWQTQVYLLSEPDGERLAPDFGRASVLWARPGSGFDPNRQDLLVLESVRSAAESGRRTVTDRGLTQALYQKFDNPMLGLLSAHALRVRNAIDPGLLATVTTNLEAILGPIPDVLALKLALDPKAVVPPIDYPPLLRWSWELLLEHSVERPEIISRYSLAEQIGGCIVDRGVWLSWIPSQQPTAVPPADAAQPASLNIGGEFALNALRQTWRQMADITVPVARTARKRAKRALESSLESLESIEVPELLGPSVKNLVQLYGVPRALVEEAVGGLMAAVPATPSPATGAIAMDQAKRQQFNERFLQRLLARRTNDRPRIQSDLEELQKRHAQRRAQPEGAMEDLVAEPPGQPRRDPRQLALETIVNRERPVLFVQDGVFNTTDVTALGPEATDLVERMKQQGSRLVPLLPLIGRIDVVNFPNNLDYVGTGWFVDTDIVVTNRHVASLIAEADAGRFAFRRGIGSLAIEASLCNAHEFDDLAPDSSRLFSVKEVLYIESPSGPDIAFLRVDRRTDGRAPGFIPVIPTDAADELPVCVIGYPARASRRVIPNQDLMKQLYRDRFDVKRAAPGFTSGIADGATTHDCTTLGGNSGSVVLDLATGNAVGLHFAGLYEEDNFAVRASVLTDYIRRKRWNSPAIIETRPASPASTAVPAASPTPQAVASGAAPVAQVTVTLPVTLTVSIGAASVGGAPVIDVTAGSTTSTPGTQPATSVTQPGTPAPPPVVDVAKVEEVLRDYWLNKPAGVLAARVGYLDEGDSIGNVPCIAASVKPAELGRFELGAPALYRGVPVRYLPADVDEQVHALPTVEAVESISYDDDARTGERFSFAQVNEPMEVILHVGPEYSWEVLEQFIKGAEGRLVSAMFEFHAEHIKDALEDRLSNGGGLQLVLDNMTFGNADEGFNRVDVFEDWAERFQFTRIVAPEGTTGLIANAYHIKVTVRDDDTFWLSSGNWKPKSSQPVITQEQRDNATTEDLPGNREWHVVIRNKKLAMRFRNHILQDLKRSKDLGGRELPKSLLEETFVDIPIEIPLELEARRPPSKILEPKKIAFSSTRKVKVKPLLTPDREGAVYSQAVLDLIGSATQSLLFQIPYIGMPQAPNQDRGFIDELIRALTQKLNTLDDARVLLRRGGSRFSAPAHAAWFFKSKGVDINERVKVIDDHHTKGMIVDGRRVLLGSHNWSADGVTLNRDASLLFDDEEVATYYTEAFNIDWNRASKITPKKFVKTEAVVLEAVGNAPPPGFRRVPLSELLKDD